MAKIGEILESLTNAAANKTWVATAVGAGGILITLGAIDETTAKGIVESMQKVMDGFGIIVGGLKQLYIVVLPILTALLARSSGLATMLRGLLGAVNSKAEKDGLKVLTAEGGKAAVIAKELPGENVTVVPADQQVKVIVPAATQPAPAPGL